MFGWHGKKHEPDGIRLAEQVVLLLISVFCLAGILQLVVSTVWNICVGVMWVWWRLHR